MSAVMKLNFEVDLTSGCHIWTGSTNGKGYAQGWLPERKAVILMHRYMYEQVNGPIPDGFQIDHLCRVRHCVNPEHMEPVTPRENTLRGLGPTSANAHKAVCSRGHAFDEPNTKIRTDGHRMCRECRRRTLREARRRKREAREEQRAGP